MSRKNLAAIDLGTNSCRLKITDENGNLIYREAVTTKLGEGMIKNMRFTDEALGRGLNCFNHYAELMEDYNVGSYRAIATASCRMAENGAQFVKMVEELSKIKLEIVSEQEEAFLNLRGAALNAKKDAETVFVYDLGGGSTELTLALNSKEPKVLYTISVPWGARNASEYFDLCEYDEQKAQSLKTEIEKYARDFMVNSEFLKYLPKCCAIATSSTPLRLMNMIEYTESYNMDFADGLSAPIEKFDEQIEKIYKSNLVELTQNVHIGENRAPIIVAAGVIFQTIYKTLQIKELISSLKGAQEAIISDLIKGNEANGKINEISQRSARSQNLDR